MSKSWPEYGNDSLKSLLTLECIILTYRFIGLYIKNIIHLKAGKPIIH